uniref:Immunoglobulin V-set domain-containing protein n=1 Tax=Ailuropoda melanoleuca TaxID=9646 RepID=A0A7N5P840_AILME
MHCVPIKGHSYVFWYQQIPAKELKFLISFQDGVILDKTGMPEKRFSAVCPQNSPCSLEIKPTEMQDLAVYFCASSESTVDTQTLQSARSPATGSPKMGQRRVLRCDPISGHRFAYWCPQNPRQGMEFLISFRTKTLQLSWDAQGTALSRRT